MLYTVNVFVIKIIKFEHCNKKSMLKPFKNVFFYLCKFYFKKFNL